MLKVEWIKGSNGATDHIVTEISNYLDKQANRKPGAHSFPFLAIFGTVGYDNQDFPDDALDAVSTEITRLMERLEASPPGSVVRGPQATSAYSLALRGFADRASAELWIGGEWDLQEKLAKLRAVVQAVAESLPTDYQERQRGLLKASDVVRQEIAAALEKSLNEEARRHPHETYDDKKALAKWVNAELRVLGLAIKDPNTGNACHLVGSPGNRGPEDWLHGQQSQ
jgi:hypothetical protein